MSSNLNNTSKSIKKRKNINPNHKSIELSIVNAWQNESWWLWLLLPFSWLYGGIIRIRKNLYQYGILSTYRAPTPVMIIGNITVGGSGKTPLIIELVRFLQKRQLNVGVISRGYGGNETLMPSLVTSSSISENVGDEPCLIVHETGVAMSVSPNRQQAIECLLKANPNIELIIADDGLQHYKLERDIEWIVVDRDRGFGNKQLLPVGFLREPLSRLNGATVIYHETFDNQKSINISDANYQVVDKQFKNAHIMTLIPSVPTLLDISDNLKNNLLKNDLERGFDDKTCLNDKKCLTADNNPTVYGVSGIGYPQRFFKTLRELGFEVIECPKPDHHQFEVSDFSHLTQHPIVITSKDAVKIVPLMQKEPALETLQIWVLPVKAMLTANCYETLLQQLSDQGIIV